MAGKDSPARRCPPCWTVVTRTGRRDRKEGIEEVEQESKSLKDGKCEEEREDGFQRRAAGVEWGKLQCEKVSSIQILSRPSE